MRIFAIETSADETAAAIVEDGTKILSNIVASSMNLHEKTGGIIPEIAAREQIKYIIPVLEEAIERAIKLSSNLPTDRQGRVNNSNHSISQSLNILISNHIDAIAVTIGPGLIGSLLVGVETAKTIAFVTKKPIVPVNHVLAHIYANFLHFNNIYHHSEIQFPAIALVVSGGHTELFLMKSQNQLKWLGGTRDDAAGEAFDKTARLLGLGFPGGPAIAAEAAKYQISNIKYQKVKLPRPMMREDNLDFSFSGLKAAVMREINKLKSMNKWTNKTVMQFAFEIQEAITDVLVEKTLRAAKQYKVKSILLGGGVAANSRLHEKFSVLSSQFSVALHVPPAQLCTDNAAYIASFAYFNYKPIHWSQIQAQPSLSVEV